MKTYKSLLIFGIFLIIMSINTLANFNNINAFYNFDNIVGTNIPSLISSANNGTLQNGATNVSSVLGQNSALLCDGTDDWLSIADNNDIFDFGNGNFTISYLINTSWTSAGYRWVFSREPAVSIHAYGIGIDNTGHWFYASTDGSSWAYAGNQYNLNANKWIYYTIKREGNTWKFYQDGTLIKTNTSSITLTDKSTAFSLCRGQNTYYLTARIDNFGVWKGYALSDSEILQLNTTRGNFFQIVNITNSTITNINNYNNQSINNFTAIINGVTYNTNSGIITTPFLSNSTNLANITIISNNMFNTTYTNYNISSNLIARQEQYPIIILNNKWNNSNLSSFSLLIDGNYYNTTNTFNYIPFNTTKTINTIANNYFNTTKSLTVLQNTLTQINVSQSEILLEIREFDSNISLRNFTVNITGYPTLINVSGYNQTIYPNNGTYNITRIIDNTGAENYQLATTNFTINALDNKTVTLYVYVHSINITAKNIRTNATITNFTINLTDLTDGTDNRILTTTNGSLIIPVIHHNYTVTIDGGNFALYNNTVNFSINNNVNYTFYLYTTNSFDIKFYDEITKVLLSGINISLEAISDVYANNYSTNNGTLYIDLLTPDTYLLRYKSLPDYDERTYTIVLTNRTYNLLNLYLVNGSQTITINVKDQDDNNVDGAYVKILRYDLTSNSYTVREIVTTDISGNGYFQGILNTEFYKFIVEYPLGDEKLSTNADYLRSTTLTLRINTQEDTLNNYFTSIQTYATMTFNNATNTFTYYYNDATNTLSQGCLYIYKTINTQTTLSNSSCNSGSSGTITLGVVNGSGYYYNAQGTVLIDDKEYLVASKDHYFNKFTSKDSKNNFLFITILLTLAMALLFLWNITIAIILTPLPLMMMSLAELIPVSRGVTITIFLIGLTIAFMISKRS